jgi:hypothetical protein
MKHSLHNLIPFFPLFSTQFNSSAPNFILWQTGVSKLDSPLSATTTTVLFSVASQSQSQSHIATDGESISKSWCRVPSGAHDQIFITVLTVTVFFFCGTPSLTRGRVCLLYGLLVLASAVFLGSESLCTRYHILLYQSWNFPFRRLLRLADSTTLAEDFFITTLQRPRRKHSLYCQESVFIDPLPRNERPIAARLLAREYVYQVIA